MKWTRRWLSLMAVVLVVGCDGAETAVVPPGPAPAPRLAFGSKSPIPVRLTLLATSEGGRASPLHGGYRPTVTFDAGGGPLVCGLGSRVEGGFDPGETHDVVLRCASSVTVRSEALGFTVSEGEQVVGSGEVLSQAAAAGPR